MKVLRPVALLVLILAIPALASGAGAKPSGKVRLEVAQAGRWRVRVRWRSSLAEAPTRVRLWRSTADLATCGLEPVKYPIAQIAAPRQSSAAMVDNSVADGTTYYYQLQLDTPQGTLLSNVARVTTPNFPLPKLKLPHLLIDKPHYYLEVLNWTTPVKRYPIALGQDPVDRKLHQDDSTTPEGVYQIWQTQPNATYYRAYDIDYPNTIDKIRYAVAKSHGLVPPHHGPGGEIEIHGDVRVDQAVLTNWTYGCIAMRNRDLDELFSHPEIGPGCWVYIVGKDMTRKDLDSILEPRSQSQIEHLQQRLETLGYDAGDVNGVMDADTERAIGAYQLQMGLPLTCQLDTRTAERLLSSTPPRPPAGYRSSTPEKASSVATESGPRMKSRSSKARSGTKPQRGYR